jgi:hypothetical protein
MGTSNRRIRVPRLDELEQRRDEMAPGAGRTRGPVTGAGHLPHRSEALAGEAARALQAGHAERPRGRGAGTSAAHLLALQGAAGNRAVAASVQRAPAAAPAHAPAHAKDRNDYIDLLNGFEDLATAAVNQGGRGLDTVHFGHDLSPAHHSFLEHIRNVLILAQEESPDARRTAIAEWPQLADGLRTALTHAKQLGVPDGQLTAIAENVSLVGEKYIHVPRRGPSQAENPDDYADLMSGTQRLLGVVQEEAVDKRDAVVPVNIQEINEKQRKALGAVQFGGHLTKRHRDLLENLRTVLILARTESPGSARRALTLWKSIQGDMRHAFQRAPEFVSGDVGAIQQELDGIGEQLIDGGVYAEAHNEAVKETNLQAPDLAFQAERFKEAAEGFEELHKFADKALQLTGENAIDVVLSGGKFEPGLAHAIFELVKSPGEIVEKLHEFREKGLIGKAVTVADLADKTLALRNATIKVSCEVLKRFAEAEKGRALAAGAEVVVERWSKVAEWAGEKLEMLEKVEKVAAVLTIVISAVKIIDLISQGKWGEALKEAGTTALGLAAGAAGGAGGAAMVGGIAIVVAAEIEGIAGAAAMIRYCEKANVRDAALSFVDVCRDAANIEARDFVADAKLLADASNTDERALIEKKLASYHPGG